MRARRPELAEAVAAECGEAPWIVRSSGAEDQEDNVNAGGYESLICRHADDLHATLAAVAFSGYGEQSIAQQRLTDPAYRPSPIAAFVQPLVEVPLNGTGRPVPSGDTPLLGDADVAALTGWLTRLHRFYAMPRLDSEWVLSTDAGAVSITGLTELSADGRLVGQLSLGFGFASAQNLGDEDNSLAWLTGLPGTTLWRGALLRHTRVDRTHLVQARPANAFDPEPTLHTLTDESRARWQTSATTAPVDILVPPRLMQPSSFLTAVRLEDAWSRYVSLDAPQREQIGHVLVERGSPSEHAAVMFRQHGVAVLRGQPENVVEGASYALVDPWRQECYFGTGRPPAAETHTRRTSAVPQGCRLLFTRDAGTAHAAGSPPQTPVTGPDTMPGHARLRALDHLPEHARERIVRDSYLPTADSYRRHGAEVTSPSFVAQVADALLALGRTADRVRAALPAEAGPYLRGLAAARAQDGPSVAAVLPRCARAAGQALTRSVAGALDVRLPVALARLETSRTVSDRALKAVLPRTLALAATGGPPHTDAALALLAAVESLAAAMHALDLYTEEERDDVLARTVAELPVDDPVRTTALSRFAARTSAPPGETHRLLALAAADEQLAARYLALERCRLDLSAADVSDVARRALALNDAYRAYAAADAWRGGHDAVPLDLTRADLIETYDSTLKRLLLDLVDRPGEAGHRAYLDVLAGWLALIGQFELSPVERQGLVGFEGWLADWRDGPVVDDHTLDEEETWQRLLERAAAFARDGEGEAPDTPHQLHNALHQWLLARTPRYPAERAPARVRELHRMSDRFGPGGDKLLRFTRDGIELDVPLGIHKASLLFRPDRVEGEWTEPPDVPAEETGRLNALSTLLVHCNTWFPELVFTSERRLMAGTWTLQVEARPPAPSQQLTYPQMRLALGVFRTLFDGSYDFSYVPVDDVTELADAFKDPRWAAVVRSLVEYRTVYDDSEQFETLETLPLGTAVGMLCTSEDVRAQVLAAAQEGPDEALDRLDAAWQRLARTEEPADWIALHNVVQQLALLVAALFPEDAVRALATARPSGWGSVLAAAVLPRDDVRESVSRAFAGQQLHPLLLRHAPWLAVTDANAADVARHVTAQAQAQAGAGARAGAHRRCKQYLVHRYAHLLEPAGVLAALVADLDVVPHGRTPLQEQPLAAAVEAAGGRLRRDVRTKFPLL
ncbi:hypothetical protein [Streptomyces sp. NPDC047315]|uniref:hypothetical protein n=1 Tax=Streptomyces sp. NPDC047315 TaxID=3155142 RepID=UPI0033D9DB4C